MNTDSKSCIQEMINNMERARDEIPFGLDGEQEMTLDAFIIALRYASPNSKVEVV